MSGVSSISLANDGNLRMVATGISSSRMVCKPSAVSVFCSTIAISGICCILVIGYVFHTGSLIHVGGIVPVRQTVFFRYIKETIEKGF